MNDIRSSLIQDSGPQPAIEGTSVADRSLRVATALCAEVAMLRDRLEIVERLALERGLFGPEDIDSYRPGPALAAAMKARRKSLIARVFGALRP